MPRQAEAGDFAIGERIKAYRLNAGMSQSDLGASVGITFQQIQKYEKGKNRVSGSRLLGIAKALNTTPADLLGAGGMEAAEPEAFKLLASEDGAKLAKAFACIKSASHRAAVVDLARTLAS